MANYYKMKKNSKYFSSFFKIALTTLIIFLFTSSFKIQGRKEDSLKSIIELRLEVLEANSIGKVYEYDLTRQEGCNKTKLTYLGIVTTGDRKKYKLLRSFWVTGHSCRGVSNLIIYDLKNVYIGSYRFDMPYELPDLLINNEIVYISNHVDCENRKGRKISFENGLPKCFHVCGGFRCFQ